MEEATATNPEAYLTESAQEIIKPQLQCEQKDESSNEKQQQQQQQQLQNNEEQVKVVEIPNENQEQVAQTQPIVYELDDDDDDDDEEKETSQKLVIDLPDDAEEEEEEEQKVEDDDEVIALDDLPQVSKKESDEKVCVKPIEVDAIITLSDGEEDAPANEVVTKPGKVQKRRSMGASSPNEEEHYRLKRRKINAAGAPKLPLTGYVRYMNDRRESMRKEHPSKTHMEHTKLIGEEWHALPSDVKSSYLKAADVDKQRYVKELDIFLKSRPDILASELAKNKIRKTAESNGPNVAATAAAAAAAAVTASTGSTKTVGKDKPAATTNDISKLTKESLKDKVSKEVVPAPSTSQQATDKHNNNEKNKRKRTPTPPSSATNSTNASSATGGTAGATTTTNSSSIVTATPGEIPIFTNEFLEHNKIYDIELRSLRKTKTDLEQQNSVLEKHVENMKFGVEKMITENNELEEKNRLLEIYLDKLKRKLAVAFSGLPLPSAPNGATNDNIDKYMQDLYKMATSNSTGPATLNKAKDIIRKLDLQIQL